jgi:hypothetical protein
MPHPLDLQHRAEYPGTSPLSCPATRFHVQPENPSDDDDAPETPRERLAINVGIVVFVVLLIGAGLWLVNAMSDARRADECLSAGRRNCAPVQVPPPER